MVHVPDELLSSLGQSVELDHIKRQQAVRLLPIASYFLYGKLFSLSRQKKKKIR